MRILKRLFIRRDHRIATDERATAKSEAIHERIQAQWPEVRDLARWARTTREDNHLTKLFKESLNGGHA